MTELDKLNEINHDVDRYLTAIGQHEAESPQTAYERFLLSGYRNNIPKPTPSRGAMLWFMAIVAGYVIAAVVAVAILTSPAKAEIKNDDLHAPFSAVISNSINLYLYKTQPDLTYWQRYKRSFAGCMAVGVVVEGYQGISGNGVADLKDLGRDAAGCALQFKWEWRF